LKFNLEQQFEIVTDSFRGVLLKLTKDAYYLAIIIRQINVFGKEEYLEINGICCDYNSYN